MSRCHHLCMQPNTIATTSHKNNNETTPRKDTAAATTVPGHLLRLGREQDSTSPGTRRSTSARPCRRPRSPPPRRLLPVRRWPPPPRGWSREIDTAGQSRDRIEVFLFSVYFEVHVKTISAAAAAAPEVEATATATGATAAAATAAATLPRPKKQILHVLVYQVPALELENIAKPEFRLS